MTTTHADPASSGTTPGPDTPGGVAPGGEAASPTRRPSLPYFPALDGLRGIAVAAVLAYHGGFSWMVGGFLGVSTFFTLSGFLITALALGEHGSGGRIDLKAFWVRRARRLLPASLACLVLVLAFGVFAADVVQRENLAGDVVAALADVANWRFIIADQSYADLFAAPSPVLHFWSLAIEEQFYLLFPLLLTGLVAAGTVGARSTEPRRRSWFGRPSAPFRHTLGAALVALTAGSLAVTLLAGFEPDRIYFGTDTRAAELLLGGILATVLFDGQVTTRLARPGWLRTVAAAVGAVALVVCVASWVGTAQTSDWLYDGGLALYAVLSCLVVAAAVLPVGAVRSVLAVPPLRHLGRISYGVYLYHWPIFLWLRQQTDLGQWPRFVVGVAITLTLAEASYRYLEMPVRRGGPVLSYRPRQVAPLAAALVVAGAVAVSATAPPPIIDFGRSEDELLALGAAAPTVTTTSTIDPVALVPPPPRVAFFGDSTALQTGLGVADHLIHTGAGTVVPGSTPLGCPLLRTDAHRAQEGSTLDKLEACRWDVVYPRRLAEFAPTVAVVQAGVWDIGDQRLPGDERWVAPGDPSYDEFARAELARVVDTLSADGALVVWLTGPPMWKMPDPDETARRMARYNELVRELPAARPGRIEVIDLAGWVAALPPEEDRRLRVDGTHFTRETSNEVADAWLAGEVLTRYRDWWTARRTVELETGGTPVQALVVGDATADDLAGGLIRWADRHGTLGVQTAILAQCGFGGGSERIGFNGPEPMPAPCSGWGDEIALTLVGQSPEVVVVAVGLWDLTDRARPGWGGFRSPGDPAYDADLLDALERAADTMHATGARVLWLTVPPVTMPPDADPAAAPNAVTVAADPARVARVNELIREMAATRRFVEVFDLAAFATAPDGLGGPAGGLEVAARLPVAGADAVAGRIAPGLVAIGRSTEPGADPAGRPSGS
jgi:peptidoglycan/LPS O-acetylase OafA/YrhL/lysophospholipase L1-like esterase